MGILSGIVARDIFAEDAHDFILQAWAEIFYADGEDVLTATTTPEANRQLLASGRICAIEKYVGLGFTPWDGNPGTHRSNLTSVTFASDMASYSALRLDCLLYSWNLRLFD